jgi:aspartate/methionine/tyrosine aminotransferase
VRPNDFLLERYFAAHEFSVRYVLSASDPESLSLDELLALADEQARRMWDRLSLGYTESQGHPLLREEIARLYAAAGPEGVLVTVPEEGILIAMAAILQPGDHVIATFPAYQSLLEIPRAIGSEVTPWPLQPTEGGWQLDLDFLAAHLTARTRLIIVNFPHNPTGYLPAAAVQAAILELARSRGLYVFSDEMYWGLEYDRDRRLTPACDLYERAVTLSGLSKSLALPGLRIGWLASRDHELLARCSRFKDYTTICAGAPSEILAIMALRARAQILERNLAIIRRNLQTAGQFFAGWSSLFEWLPPAAGSVAFPRLQSSTPAAGFCRDLRERKGVLLAPAEVFAYAGNHFRLGLGRLNFAEALAELHDYLAAGGLAA